MDIRETILLGVWVAYTTYVVFLWGPWMKNVITQSETELVSHKMFFGVATIMVYTILTLFTIIWGLSKTLYYVKGVKFCA